MSITWFSFFNAIKQKKAFSITHLYVFMCDSPTISMLSNPRFLCHLSWPQSNVWYSSALILLLPLVTPYSPGFLPGSSLPISSFPALWLTSINGALCGLVLDSILFLGFIVFLGDLRRSFGFKYHPNAEDLRFLFLTWFFFLASDS